MSKLKTLSRVSTTVIELTGSVERVVSGNPLSCGCASCSSIRLPRGVGFRPTSESVWHSCASFLRDVLFLHGPVSGASGFVEEFLEDTASFFPPLSWGLTLVVRGSRLLYSSSSRSPTRSSWCLQTPLVAVRPRGKSRSVVKFLMAMAVP